MTDLQARTRSDRKLSPWIVVSDHCAARILQGGDIENVADRIAFIEKTPRVRVLPLDDTADVLEDFKKWTEGPSGPGGPDGHLPANELYGFCPASRAWCDAMLVTLGYELS